MSAIWHRYSFPSIAARDASFYFDIDVNQWVKVAGSPPTTYQITSVSNGIATFAQLGGGGSSADTAALQTTGASVNVSLAAPPTSGQVLTSTNATHATWQTPAPGGVTSFNSRTGAVVPVSGDYTAAQVTNDSGVIGTTVADALNTLSVTVLPSMFWRYAAP